MKQALVPYLVLALGLAAGVAAADDCSHRADREASLDTAGVRSVRIDAGAGELRVEGRAGQTRVEATGVACASTEQILGQIRLTARREGDVIVVKAEIPDGDQRGWNDQAKTSCSPLRSDATSVFCAPGSTALSRASDSSA